MRIPAGIIFVWGGSNASIPSGWQRETSLDGKYPKGNASSGTDPNVTGGSAQHSHSSPTGSTHSHTENAHTHTWTIGVHAWGGSSSGEGTTVIARADHIHTVNSQNMSGGGLQSVQATYALVDNDPPYRKVIFVKPSTTSSELEVGVIGFVDDTTFVNNTGKWVGFYKCDGSNSTPDFTDKYLKGASTGADADVSSSLGSLTNVHTLTHTHVVTAHSHSGTTGGASQGCDADTDANNAVNYNHTHSWASSSVQSTYSGTVQLTTLETVEPAYKKLVAVRNNSGKPFIGLIGMWLSTLGAIPKGWTKVDMYGKHLKITNTPAHIGNTGGSNTHSHASQTHNHTAGTHTHSITSGLNHPTAYRDSTSGTSTQETLVSKNPIHSHSVSTNSASFADASTSGEEQSNEPEYRTVQFIKLASVSRSGAFLL